MNNFEFQKYVLSSYDRQIFDTLTKYLKKAFKYFRQFEIR